MRNYWLQGQEIKKLLGLLAHYKRKVHVFYKHWEILGWVMLNFEPNFLKKITP